MLQLIAFCIYDKKAAGELPRLEEELRSAGIASGRTLLAGDGESEAKDCLADWRKRLCEEGLALTGVLFVTDSAPLAALIAGGQGYTAVLFTQRNREESFAGIAYALESLAGVEPAYFCRLYERCAGIPWEILRTARCIVREMRAEDVKAFYRIYGEPSITAYMENLFEREEDEIAYTRAYIKNVYGFYGYGMWVIVKRDTGEVIGRAGVEYKEAADGLEIGYVIAKPYQRQGFAAEVCSEILRYANRELGFHKVSSYVQEQNLASICLCRKLGMTEAGRRQIQGRQHLVFEKHYTSRTTLQGAP